MNPDQILPQLSYDNNVGETVVEVAALTGGPVDACVGQVGGLQRECGRTKRTSHSCTPGAIVAVGCSGDCGIGTNDGDTIMRICPSNEACTFPGVGGNDDWGLSKEGGVGSRVRFTRPVGGRFTVMTGSLNAEDPAISNFAIQRGSL